MNWLLRVGNGVHFCNSSHKKVWAVNSKNSCNNKSFIKNVKPGDKLWFVTSNSSGKIIAVSTFEYIKPRELGPLISLTETNEDRGWTEKDGDWDTDIYYYNLYLISSANLLSCIKSPANIRLYNDKCKVKLPEEYIAITKYLKPVSLIKIEDL